jgi:hypothetical protein
VTIHGITLHDTYGHFPSELCLFGLFSARKGAPFPNDIQGLGLPEQSTYTVTTDTSAA